MYLEPLLKPSAIIVKVSVVVQTFFPNRKPVNTKHEQKISGKSKNQDISTYVTKYTGCKYQIQYLLCLL